MARRILEREGTQTLPATNATPHRSSRNGVLFFNDLNVWVEINEATAPGYLEAMHVLGCRCMLDDVMDGTIQPKNMPLFSLLEDYFAI